MDSVNATVANLIAEQVYQRIKKDLQLQWDTVITELVNTRKVTENTKATLAESQRQNSRLEQIIFQKESELQTTQTTQAKAAKILDKALEELGLGE